MNKSVFLVAFFRFDEKGSEYGFERIDLQHIWETEEEARTKMSFCDEAGWYEGALIEERQFGCNHRKSKRIWLISKITSTGVKMEEIPEPEWYKNTFGLIG